MKILLVRTGGLGDCILTLPVASCLRRINPGSELHVLGNATMLDVASLTGEFDILHAFDCAGFADLFSGSEPSLFLRTFFSPFDEVYFFSAADRELISSAVTTAGAQACHVCNPKQPAGWNRHITEHLLSIIEINDEHSRLRCIPFLKPPKSSVGKREGLVIHPGSGGTGKIWPVDRFIAVAGEWGDDVTFVLGPAELELGLAGEIPERFSVVCPETLEDLAEILSGASVYLGNDSGVSHCAALCGTRSIVLFGPTAPAVWKPLGEEVVIVTSGDCTMEGISCDEVLGAFESGGWL